MKRTLRIFALVAVAAIMALVVIPCEAWAAFAPTRILNLYVLNKLLVGTGTEANAVTKMLAGPVAGSTIDFASAREGSELSAAITVTGAVAGDPCFVGVPTAAGALKAEFECAVTATNEVKIRFSPQSKQVGTATLVSASPSTVDVTNITASSYCTATPEGTTAAIAAGGIAASLTSTTLTLTGPNTVATVVKYSCAAPVDPASGVYFVRVLSQQ